MCLQEPQPLKPDEPTEGYGNKVFRIYPNGSLSSELYNPDGSATPAPEPVHWPIGEWVAATGKRIRLHRVDQAPRSYPAGFHVFLRKTDARVWRGSWRYLTIRRVQFRTAHTREGRSGAMPVIVAKEVRIVPVP